MSKKETKNDPLSRILKEFDSNSPQKEENDARLSMVIEVDSDSTKRITGLKQLKDAVNRNTDSDTIILDSITDTLEVKLTSLTETKQEEVKGAVSETAEQKKEGARKRLLKIVGGVNERLEKITGYEQAYKTIVAATTSYSTKRKDIMLKIAEEEKNEKVSEAINTFLGYSIELDEIAKYMPNNNLISTQKAKITKFLATYKVAK